MPPIINLVGQRYGRLVVLQRGKNIGKNAAWTCKCDCGNTHTVSAYKLRSKEVQSCGCLRKEKIASVNRTHGKSKTSIYAIWRAMKDRCHNPKNKAYKRYGGRGIRVCERWMVFENFYEDMGERPSSKHSIDRIDNSNGYSVENCRWATMKEQQRNKENNVVVGGAYKGLTIPEICEKYGLKHSTVYRRITHGQCPVRETDIGR